MPSESVASFFDKNENKCHFVVKKNFVQNIQWKKSWKNPLNFWVLFCWTNELDVTEYTFTLNMERRKEREKMLLENFPQRKFIYNKSFSPIGKIILHFKMNYIPSLNSEANNLQNRFNKEKLFLHFFIAKRFFLFVEYLFLSLIISVIFFFTICQLIFLNTF